MQPDPYLAAVVTAEFLNEVLPKLHEEDAFICLVVESYLLRIELKFARLDGHREA